jgi:hypothetical protein
MSFRRFIVRCIQGICSPLGLLRVGERSDLFYWFVCVVPQVIHSAVTLR